MKSGRARSLLKYKKTNNEKPKLENINELGGKINEREKKIKWGIQMKAKIFACILILLMVIAGENVYAARR